MVAVERRVVVGVEGDVEVVTGRRVERGVGGGMLERHRVLLAAFSHPLEEALS